MVVEIVVLFTYDGEGTTTSVNKKLQSWEVRSPQSVIGDR